MVARYSVEYYPGEDNERLPEWCVVRWDTESIGSTVYKTYDLEEGEGECGSVLEALVYADNLEVFNNQ